MSPELRTVERQSALSAGAMSHTRTEPAEARVVRIAASTKMNRRITPEKSNAMANKISDTRYREAAHRLHHEEGVCEVDENAKISRGSDPGAYVQAWVWVYNADTKRKLTPDELTRWQTPGTKKVTRSSAGDSGRDWLE